jgi:hypothetical protein
MTEEQYPKTEGTPSQPATPEDDPWKEVGSQFQALGHSLATAFQAAWKNEAMRQQAQEMKAGIESLAKEVGQAVKDTSNSPHVQQARSEAARAAGSLKDAGEKTAQEVRPHLLKALQQVNLELQKFIRRLEGTDAETGEGSSQSGPDQHNP